MEASGRPDLTDYWTSTGLQTNNGVEAMNPGGVEASPEQDWPDQDWAAGLDRPGRVR